MRLVTDHGFSFQAAGEGLVLPRQRLQLRLHLGLQSRELRLVAALALFRESLQGLSRW